MGSPTSSAPGADGAGTGDRTVGTRVTITIRANSRAPGAASSKFVTAARPGTWMRSLTRLGGRRRGATAAGPQGTDTILRTRIPASPVTTATTV